MTDNVLPVAARFFPPLEIAGMEPHGTGKVNDTFLVKTSGAGGQSFILQRISSAVFAHPEWIMENMRVLFDHVEGKLRQEPERGWRLPGLHQTLDGRDFYRDGDGSCWRVLRYIAKTRSFDTMENVSQAREVGLALGRFHRLISDLDPARLHDTLPGFHITPRYLGHYDRVAQAGRHAASPDIVFCHDFIARRRAQAGVLEAGRSAGKLTLRPIHGDPKLSNFLFDEESGKAVSLIDLDTVKPGLIQYDVGDCLRSCCNRAGEESSPGEVFFDTERCRAILQGYVAEAGGFLTSHDYDYFYDGLRVIAFELGLRFFTDYLEGNIYFKTLSAEQNLQRALVQFALAASIEKQAAKIAAICCELNPWA
ncbi:MAG: aminoglycoside phosphotransferase family protein [Deltaproteobacteria bacterium]|nr:aminoglycoside phosphotransferase family protein [Deltaproteobacteria bacterium]